MNTRGTIKPCSSTFDRLGTAVSWVCVAHCIALPLATLIVPAFAHNLPDHDLTHTLLAFWVVAFAALALLKNDARKPSVVFYMALGVTLVLIATFSGLSETMELPLIFFGNFLVVIAHHFNRTQSCCAAQA